MINKDELFDEVVGGREMPRSFIREDIVESNHLVVSSALDRRMARSITLHPKLKIRFRNKDLASLSDRTKEALLEDIQYVLGIRRLRNE